MPTRLAKILPYFMAMAGMAAVTAAFLPFRHLLDNRPATVAFAQLMLVLLVTARWGAGPALAAAVLGLVGFDAAFLRHTSTWPIEHPEDGVLLLAFIATSLAVGRMATQSRRRASEAEAGHREIERLYADLQSENAERRRTEANLRESEFRYRSLMESAPDALVVVGEDGRIQQVNARAEALFGYARSELAGQTVEVLVPDARRERHAEHRRAYLADPQPRQIGTDLELCGRRRDGSVFPADITLSPLRLSDGLLITAAVRDISERKLLESERLARRSAEAANRAKSRFLANISHELRSPLNTILGFTRLMTQTPELPGSIREDLGLVLKSSEHLYELIDDVLQLSKLEAGQASLEAVDFDLDWLLEELRGLFAPSAAEKGLRLVFSPRPDLPRHLRSDVLKLRKVLINLIGNAIKFTGAGQVDVSVEARADPAANGRERLQFAVADTGPGIAADAMPHLFAPFGPAGAGGEARSGLGLAISRGLVQAMGGTLRIDSEAGHGTTVRFDLPLQAAAGSAPRAERRPDRIVGLAPGQPRYRILVADDYAEARRLLVRLLTPLGFEVREAANGQEAIEWWRDWQPDLIWMDMRMPVLDGREATRRIRAAGQGTQPVIVALTASSFEGKRDDILAAGCDDFLRKPFPQAQLFALMEKHLGARFVREEESAPAAAPREPEAAAVAALPEALRLALVQALKGLDIEAVDQAIDAIRAHDAALGAALAASARDFQYERLLALIESGKG